MPIDALIQAFGRGHLVVLHFPIALLITALGLEFARLAVRKLRPATILGGPQKAGQEDSTTAAPFTSPIMLAIVAIAALFTVGTATSGWFYAEHDFQGDTALQTHRWLGIATAGAAVLALLAALIAAAVRSLVAHSIYVMLLACSALLAGLTGHLGGDLVHGENYILQPITKALKKSEEPAPHRPKPTPNPTPQEPEHEAEPALPIPIDTTGPEEEPTPEDQPESGPEAPAPLEELLPVSFELDVLPIFERSCVRCHDANKAKGGVRLDTLEEAMWTVYPGQPDLSDIVIVIELPEDDPDHMPENRPSLPKAEIQTIRDWIAQMKP